MPSDDHQRPSLHTSAAVEVGSRKAVGGTRQFLRNKKSEWEEYRSEVTAFELRKNLPVL
ncbi:glutamine synthetase [Streptomyces sp. NPDC005444]|uniref:glutamine synthetase n=1 Tax=unclassified Streptomyces TaxID=2593676 RepID=UPI0033A54C5F